MVTLKNDVMETRPKGYSPALLFDAGEVHPHWYRPSDGDTIEMPWPFHETYVSIREAKAAGFRVF